MDSCVHHIAALRAVGKAAGLGELVEASANAMSLSQDLPPPDTVVGTVKFASSTPASISITFAGSVLRFSLSVVGTKGSLEVLRGGWHGTAGYQLSYKTGASRESTVEQVPFNGLDEELIAFVDQVNAAQGRSKGSSQDISDAAYRTSVEEGARDLAVVEALLESSRQGSQTVHIKEVPTKTSS